MKHFKIPNIEMFTHTHTHTHTLIRGFVEPFDESGCDVKELNNMRRRIVRENTLIPGVRGALRRKWLRRQGPQVIQTGRFLHGTRDQTSGTHQCISVYIGAYRCISVPVLRYISLHIGTCTAVETRDPAL